MDPLSFFAGLALGSIGGILIMAWWAHREEDDDLDA